MQLTLLLHQGNEESLPWLRENEAHDVVSVFHLNLLNSMLYEIIFVI